MYDCVIIGAGPAGMSAAVYLNNANKKIIVLEKDTPGGKILKAKKINNYLGLDNIEPSDIAYNMYSQLMNNKIKINIEKVLNISKDDSKIIITTDKNSYITKYVILACGKIEKSLNLDKEDELIGNGISYCAECDGNLYKDKVVSVIGNNNESIKDAIYLSSISKEVIYINYSNEEVKFDHDNIKVINNLKVSELICENNILKGVKLSNEVVIEVDGLFILTGSTPNSKIIENLNINLDNGYIVVDNNMKTNIDNIYAVGDIIKKQLYQIVTAASEGAIAAVNIAKLIN